jgi:hypothetical protein
MLSGYYFEKQEYSESIQYQTASLQTRNCAQSKKLQHIFINF